MSAAFFLYKVSFYFRLYEIFINFFFFFFKQVSFLDKDHLFCINFGPHKSGFLVQICSFLFWMFIIYGLSIQTTVSQKFAFALNKSESSSEANSGQFLMAAMVAHLRQTDIVFVQVTVLESSL